MSTAIPAWHIVKIVISYYEDIGCYFCQEAYYCSLDIILGFYSDGIVLSSYSYHPME